MKPTFPSLTFLGVSLLSAQGAALSVADLVLVDSGRVSAPIIIFADSGIAAAPDTGNWTDAVRYTALAKAFPLAVTCDFKAMQIGPDGEHPQYDLERCFRTGWDAGFRGPWCLEHFNETLPGLLKGMVTLRERLEAWMRDAK